MFNRTLCLALIFTVISAVPVQAEMATLLFPGQARAARTVNNFQAPLPDAAPDAFCDPVEISIAVALNAFEQDYSPAPGEKIRNKKPVRWSVVKQYRSLPFDAVPFAVINRGTRSEGYFNLNGQYAFGEPGQEELARLLLEQDHFVEIVFSVYDQQGRLVEDVAGVYQVNAATQTLDRSIETSLKRLVDHFRNENALLVHERYCETIAEKAMDRGFQGNFEDIYSISDFVERRCNALGQTPLYTASDLYAYNHLLYSINEGLEMMMFQLRSSESSSALMRQCRSAMTRVAECIETLNETVNNAQ